MNRKRIPFLWANRHQPSGNSSLTVPSSIVHLDLVGNRQLGGDRLPDPMKLQHQVVAPRSQFETMKEPSLLRATHSGRLSASVADHPTAK